MRALLLLFTCLTSASGHRAIRAGQSASLRSIDRSVESMRKSLQQDRLAISADQAKLMRDQEQLIKLQQQEIELERSNPDSAMMQSGAIESAMESLSPASSEPASVPESVQYSSDVTDTQSAVEPESADASTPSAGLEPSEPQVADSAPLTEALHSYFQKHNPEKDSNVDEIVKRFGDNPQKLSDELKAKYGEALDYAASTPQFREATAKVGQRQTLLTQALHSYFQAHNPAKESNVDEIVRRYGDDVATLSDRLQAKYGKPLVVPDVVSNSVMLEEVAEAEMLNPEEIKTKLLKLYAENEPSKLPYVDSILGMYEGREMEVLHRVEEKFEGL